jgi:hypothetical protein
MLAALLKLEMLDGVGHIHIGSVEADPRQRLIENATGGADERPAGAIFAITGLARRPA